MKSVKRLLVFSLVAASLVAAASGVFLQKFISNDGRTFIYVQNRTPDTYFCFISGDYYYTEFYSLPHSDSRVYPEPYGLYRWECTPVRY